jgi:hypothetical protein
MSARNVGSENHYDVSNPLGYSSESLVNRKKQINQFDLLLDKLSHRKPISTPIIQWHGGPGIGKTSLIELLVDNCRKRDISFSWIDFGFLDIKTYYEDPTLLIEKVVFGGWKVSQKDGEMLMRAIGNFRQTIKTMDQLFIVAYEKRSQQKIPIDPKWLDELKLVGLEFEAVARQKAGLLDANEEINRIHPLVIFFDETEDLKREFVNWIEDNIFRPLSLLPMALVVWTGRKPWQWRRPEVRQRVYNEKLEVFNGVGVETQMEAQLTNAGDGEDLAKQLFQNVLDVTGGHPFANKVVIGKINSWTEDKNLVTSESFIRNQPELFDRIFNDFILKYAFEKLSDEQRTACELLGMVRRFDVKMLQEVAKASKLTIFDKMDRDGFRYLLDELKKAQFMDWNQGFVLDQPLRHLISEYYYWRRKEEYIDINRVALKVNEEWLAIPVDNRGLFIIETLYHNACLKRAGVSIELDDALRQKMSVFPKENHDALKDSLTRLAGELRRDAELAGLFSVLDEMGLLGEHEKLNHLVESIEKYAP